MTERDFFKNEVLKPLSEKLKTFDFKLLKSACEFSKKTEFGWNKYQIVFLIRENGGWELKPSLLIRFDVVEDTFHLISEFDKKHQKVTPTIGTAIEDLDNYKGINARFELTSENQINSIVDNLFDLFKNVALPFFEKFSNLSAIDEQLNYNINDTSLLGDIFKGTKSLIIAKLMKRSDFDALENVYHSYYKNFADGFYLPEYLRLKELLKSNA